MARQAQVIVAAFIGPDGLAIGAAKDLERWRRLTPLADWTTINLASTARSEIFAQRGRRARAKAYCRTSADPARGNRHAARARTRTAGCTYLRRHSCDRLPCPPLPFRIMPTAAAMRLVVQGGSHSASPDFVRALLVAAGLDRRTITLIVGRSDARAAVSAADTFILELVATVGRQACHGDRTNDIQDS
jgi:hypothetical protein